MSLSEGWLIQFDERQRHYLIKQRLDDSFVPFSDTLAAPDWKARGLSAALLGFSESSIDYMALASRGNRVATSKVRVNFSELVDLGSIPVAELEAELDGRIRPHFVKSTRGFGGPLPEKTWQGLIEAVKRLRPDAAHDVDRLLSLQRFSDYHFGGRAAEVLLQEREAIGAALDIFSGKNDLRTDVLRGWAPPPETVAEVDSVRYTGTLTAPEGRKSSFLRGLPGRYLREENAIQHDLFNWPGATAEHEAGISVFQLGNRQLEVVYANQNALERTLGVDLIYFNEIFDLFVLVQYKLMREEGDQMIYRPDAQLQKELDRMNAFSRRYASTAFNSHEAYRLNPDGFMLKLVPNRGLKPASGELIKGMYLPREYVRFLLGPDAGKGPRGGTVLSFTNSPRYLTNTEFAQAVNRGWIGTAGVQSDALRGLVRQYCELGNAVILARESRVRRSQPA